jgi:hypothetical protein
MKSIPVIVLLKGAKTFKMNIFFSRTRVCDVTFLVMTGLRILPRPRNSHSKLSAVGRRISCGKHGVLINMHS